MPVSLSEPTPVTFVVIAYRQERFIREAVAGALAQTYSPLEVILSDDCSPDGTFGILRRVAENYHGPHRGRLNRNAANRHLPDHLNELLDMSTGEWVATGAGGDGSLPDRIQTVSCHFTGFQWSGPGLRRFTRSGTLVRCRFAAQRWVLGPVGVAVGDLLFVLGSVGLLRGIGSRFGSGRLARCRAGGRSAEFENLGWAWLTEKAGASPHSSIRAHSVGPLHAEAYGT